MKQPISIDNTPSQNKIINKNTINGYCGLNNGLINVVNIPNLPESLIINLTSD